MKYHDNQFLRLAVGSSCNLRSEKLHSAEKCWRKGEQSGELVSKAGLCFGL